MKHLYQLLSAKVDAWRAAGYPCAGYPAIAEVLTYQRDEETSDPRYLRSPQLRALEAYWYLRLIEGTPRIADLYLQYREAGLYETKQELVDALGVPPAAWQEPKVDTELAKLFCGD